MLNLGRNYEEEFDEEA